AFPAVNPLRDAVLQILGVGNHFHFAAFFDRAEAFDRGAEFHAVVGGVRLGAPHLLFVFVVAQDRRPTSRSRIAKACAVSDQLDLLHRAARASPWKNASTSSRMGAASRAW